MESHDHLPHDDPNRPEEGAGHEEHARPDHRPAPDNPPVDERDLERGQEKLDQVITK